MLANHMREMDTEQHFRYFRMSKYFLMTSYIELHPISNTKTPTVSSKPPEFHRDQLWRYGSSGSSQQCVAPVDRSFISMATTANQSKCETNQNDVCDVTGFNRCKSYVFFRSFLSQDTVDRHLSFQYKTGFKEKKWGQEF